MTGLMLRRTGGKRKVGGGVDGGGKSLVRAPSILFALRFPLGLGGRRGGGRAASNLFSIPLEPQAPFLPSSYFPVCMHGFSIFPRRRRREACGEGALFSPVSFGPFVRQLLVIRQGEGGHGQAGNGIFFLAKFGGEEQYFAKSKSQSRDFHVSIVL